MGPGALSQVMIEHIRHFERMEHSYLRKELRMLRIWVRECSLTFRNPQSRIAAIP